MLDSNTRFHCLFEQSGTWKNEFIKLGFQAFDYDIRNDFFQTDYQVDLFKEIHDASLGLETWFGHMDPSKDFLIAFFPCTRFSKWVLAHLNGTAYQCQKWPVSERVRYSMKVEKQRSEMYQHFCEFVLFCLDKGFRCIIENPYDPEHYLCKYFPMLPGVVDMNRRERGDYMKKPTQFYFLNCKPSDNFIFEAQIRLPKRLHSDLDQVTRSMMSPQYANRFIREFIL